MNLLLRPVRPGLEPYPRGRRRRRYVDDIEPNELDDDELMLLLSLK